MCEDLEKGVTQIKSINDNAAVLLASHLDTYVSNQLRHLNSRYQVIFIVFQFTNCIFHVFIIFFQLPIVGPD